MEEYVKKYNKVYNYPGEDILREESEGRENPCIFWPH